MNHSTVTAAFFISLLLFMPIGLALMIWWAIRIFRPMAGKLEKSGRINLGEIAFKAVFFMIPGFALFVIFSLPAIYFNYMLKQEAFCGQMIRVNKMTAPNADLEEKCGSLDINELLQNNRNSQ